MGEACGCGFIEEGAGEVRLSKKVVGKVVSKWKCIGKQLQIMFFALLAGPVINWYFVFNLSLHKTVLSPMANKV